MTSHKDITVTLVKYSQKHSHVLQQLVNHVRTQIKHLTLTHNSSIFKVPTCGIAKAIVIAIHEGVLEATAPYIFHENWATSLTKEGIPGSTACKCQTKIISNGKLD